MFRTVVVGATDSEGSARAFERALGVVRSSGGTLHVVAALDRKEKAAPYLPAEFRYTDAGAGATDWLLGQLRTRATECDVEVVTHPVLADPGEAIVRVAAGAQADLVVVGSSSPHGHRQLGDVPKAVMDAVSCAVLVV
jgi:nucleotide-binding universal stress UspA family protein